VARKRGRSEDPPPALMTKAMEVARQHRPCQAWQNRGGACLSEGTIAKGLQATPMPTLMDLAPFLSSSDTIDHDHPSVRELAKSLLRDGRLATVQATYALVRDDFPHSFDIAGAEVSVAASDVVRYGHGICFAKSHLLAALLRANSIPAGLCYQKFARDDQGPAKTYLHGLNAVWLDGSWRRLDARGNRPSTEGPFDPARERLAYTVDPARGERDYRSVFAEPLPCVLVALRSSCTVADLERKLPPDLD
jgi:transglutaminase-like putative cysteine protease